MASPVPGAGLATSAPPPGWRVKVHNAAFRARGWLIDTPVVSPAFLSLNSGLRPLRVRRSSRLIIDGFPRSANSYCRAAFVVSNGWTAGLCTHLHSPRAIELGVRYNVPTILLLRAPDAAIRSMHYFDPVLRLETIARAYSRYYESVLDVVSDVVVATFADVTNDVGAVIESCNRRYGTAFCPYRKTPEAETEVTKLIDDAAREYTNPAGFRHVVARPVPAREQAADPLDGLGSTARRALDRARAVHEQILEKVSTATGSDRGGLG